MSLAGWQQDLLASTLPWAALLADRLGGYPDAGAGLALLAWLLLRITAWRQAKLFEWATVLYFLLAPLGRAHPPLDQAGLLLPLLLGLLALGSVVLGAPATLDYARLMTGLEWWANPHFIRVNRWLTLIWAFCFLTDAALTCLAEGMATLASVALRILIWALYAAAAWYTVVYPRWYRLHRYLPRVRAGLEPYLRVRRWPR